MLKTKLVECSNKSAKTAWVSKQFQEETTGGGGVCASRMCCARKNNVKVNRAAYAWAKLGKTESEGTQQIAAVEED